MRWDEDHQSPDVVDRRGERPQQAGLGGLVYLIPLLLRTRFGWVFLVLGGAYYAWTQFGEGDRRGASGAQSSERTAPKQDTELARFVGFVLDDAQDTWTRELAASSKRYRRAKLVLFTDATQTACGFGQAATGPFYCPADERVYVDLGFYRELEERLGARGDFAQAYVVAHEIGHHVQKVLGVTDRVQALRGNQEGATGTSVRVELQADCLAGVWAHSAQARSLLEAGDVEEAMVATAAIGDDRLQRNAKGTVRPETFTHGSSEQRGRWFRRGLESGKLEACDTFNAPVL
ncbi:MAG TPA: neutral zinc metallopeptidase [Polyangiaceae bacterium]|nr:neutral zinc metallopeptidase [Polyangiaceae bacterium]